MKIKKTLINVTLSVFAVCILHNGLFKLGFFGGGTYAEYENKEVRVFKVRDQMALISPSFISKEGIVYSQTKNEKWVNLNELNFKWIKEWD